MSTMQYVFFSSFLSFFFNFTILCKACGSACSKSVDLRFDDESSSIAFIDKTVITFSGKKKYVFSFNQLKSLLFFLF